jgi:hypothetical protein
MHMRMVLIVQACITCTNQQWRLMQREVCGARTRWTPSSMVSRLQLVIAAHGIPAGVLATIYIRDEPHRLLLFHRHRLYAPQGRGRSSPCMVAVGRTAWPPLPCVVIIASDDKYNADMHFFLPNEK